LKVGQSASITVSTSSSSSSSRFGGAFPGGLGGLGTNANGANGATKGSSTTTTTPAATGTAATGKVTEVGAVADASSGVASYPVTVAFSDSSGTYNPGATVTVAIAYDEVTDAIQVPTLAVTTTNGVSTVTVLANGKEEKRTVTTGLTSGTMVQITSGLRAGETVVLDLPTFGGTGRNGGTNAGGNGGNGVFTTPAGAAKEGGP
jgi:macrolide-specific efflux system membrane fusion protein